MSDQNDFAKYFSNAVVKDAPRATPEVVREASKRKVDAPSQPKAEQIAKLKRNQPEVLLECPVCGATHSKAGNPYSPQGLGGHIRFAHKDIPDYKALARNVQSAAYEAVEEYEVEPTAKSERVKFSTPTKRKVEKQSGDVNEAYVNGVTYVRLDDKSFAVTLTVNGKRHAGVVSIVE